MRVCVCVRARVCVCVCAEHKQWKVYYSWCAGLVRPMERPSMHASQHSRDLEERQSSSSEAKRNRWAAAGQAVLNPSLQKEQNFPNSMGRSHFPRSALPSCNKHCFCIQPFLWHGLQMLQHILQDNSPNSNCSAAACMTFTIAGMVAACMPLQQQFGIRLTNTACHWHAA